MRINTWIALLLICGASLQSQTQTWKPLDIDVTGCTNIVVNPQEPGKLYFPHHGAIATTTDNGDSWEYLNLSPFADVTPLDITFDLWEPDTWYLPVGYAGVVKTTDAGRSFAFKCDGLDLRFEFVQVLQHPERPLTLYALSDGELRRSTDGGDNWPDRLIAFNLYEEYATGLYMDPKNPDRMQICSSGENRYYETIDGGVSWRTGYLPHRSVRGYTKCADGSLWAANARSVDHGRSWKIYKEYAREYEGSFASACRVIYDAQADCYFMAQTTGMLFRMPRNDSVWTLIEPEFHDIGLAPAGRIHAFYYDDDRQVLWVEYGGRIFLSDDDARSFRHPRSGPYLGRTSIFATPAVNSDIIITNGAYTTDNGDSWIVHTHQSHEADLTIAFSPLDSALILIKASAFTDKGLQTFHRNDWWRHIYPTLYSRSIKFNPHNPHQVCGGGGHGFWCVGDSIFRKPFSPFAPAQAPGWDTTYLTPLPPDHGPYDTRDFAYHPHRDGVYYLATVETASYPHQNGYEAWIQYSEDFGRSWRPLYNEYNAFVHQIIVHPEHPDTIVVACGRGMIRSTDGGESWHKVSMPEPLTAYVYAIEIDARFPHMMYAGIMGCIAEPDDPTTGNRRGGICISSDYGATWTEMPRDGLHNFSVNCIHYHENPRRLMISTSAGIYETRLPDVVSVSNEEPASDRFHLHAVYPQPAARGRLVTVDCSIPRPGPVHLTLYDALGRTMQQLTSELSLAGRHSLRFLPEVPSSGLYYLRTRNGSSVRTVKLVIRP